MVDQVINELDGMAVILQNVVNASRENENDYQEMLRENARIDAMFEQRDEAPRQSRDEATRQSRDQNRN